MATECFRSKDPDPSGIPVASGRTLSHSQKRLKKQRKKNYSFCTKQRNLKICIVYNFFLSFLDIHNIQVVLFCRVPECLHSGYLIKKGEKQKEYLLDHRKLSTIFIRHNADRLFYTGFPVFLSFLIIKIMKRRKEGKLPWHQ